MHEFTLAQNMAEIIREKADRGKILSVDIEVGAVSGAVPEALNFCAQIVFEECLGTGIEIRMHSRPAEARCECGKTFTMETPLSPCPFCGGFSHNITSGKEVFVKSIEIDEED
jgi:hydrogenase nickel incorporation protein HypA/HybF